MDFELSEEQVQDLKDAFQLFDKNGDNKLSVHELTNVLQAVGQNPTLEEVKHIMDSADDNHDEFLSFDEYVCLLQKHLKSPQVVRCEMEIAFHRFDDTQSKALDLEQAATSADVLRRGTIYDWFDDTKSKTLDRHKLRRALVCSGQSPLSQEDADAFLAMMDKDGNQTIDVEEFVDFMCEKFQTVKDHKKGPPEGVKGVKHKC